MRRKPSRATGQARAAAGKPRARVYVSAATRLTPKMSSFFLCSRFGGSQSSQSQAASQASERTAAPGTETAGGKAECFSEEGDDSKDFDPFLSLGESDATKCEQETSAPLVMIKAGVESPSNVEFTSAAFFFFFFLLLLRLRLGCQLRGGELQGSCGRGGLLGLGESRLPAGHRRGGRERLGQVHRLPAFLLVSVSV